MDIGHAILKGIIQGLTEFLPVSSTAHLVFTDALAKVLGWQSAPPLPGEEEFYDILLHLGTLAAVLYYFRSDLYRIITLMFGKNQKTEDTVDVSGLDLRQTPWRMAFSTVMTVVFVLGMLKGSGAIMAHFGWTGPNLENISDLSLQYPQLVAFHLMITGCLLYFTESYSKQKTQNRHHSPTNGNALFIGLAQGCAAIFHGISRSGSTISAGLLSGLDRLSATRYSFLLSIPTFLMAAVYEALKLFKSGHIGHLDWPVMLVGTVFSGVIGYACVKYFVLYVAKNSLRIFAVYCWVVGFGMFFFLNNLGP